MLPAAYSSVEHARGPRSWALLLIAAAAAGLRLYDLNHSPPGLHQDEAANAWNAWCLLHTGTNQAGDSWPVLYMRALGSNCSTLYVYALLPFQAVLGLGVVSTRLPAALSGILTVLLIYYVGRRLYDRTTGLAAAALLTLNPWHLQLTRWGHEAAPVPFLVMAPVALMLVARVPILGAVGAAVSSPNPGGIEPTVNDRESRTSPVLALLAGLAAGVACYGYPAVRIFVPVFLAACTLANGRQVLVALHAPAGRRVIGAFLVGFLLLFGPLLFAHLADTEALGINKRTRGSWVWKQDDPLSTKAAKVAARYPPHFGPDFLFRRGDASPTHSPPDIGQFHWYEAPLMLAGMVAVVAGLRRNAADRFVGLWVLLYPAGDLLIASASSHALRSAPGLCGLILLAARGGVAAARMLQGWSKPVARVAAVSLSVAVAVVNLRYLQTFFGAYNHRPSIVRLYHADLLAACDWLRLRPDEYDHILCTTTGMNQPYVVTLVAQQYDPQRWFAEPRELLGFRDGSDMDRHGLWDLCTRYGRWQFLYHQGDLARLLEELDDNGRPDRVLMILRPNEDHAGGTLLQELHDGKGHATLHVVEVTR